MKSFAPLLLAVALAAVTSCGQGPGTASHDVYLTNATGQRLVVYELLRGPGLSRTVESGVTIKSSWPYPLSSVDSRKARLEADNQAGSRVYCNEFSFGDLESAGWRITIASAIDRCSS